MSFFSRKYKFINLVANVFYWLIFLRRPFWRQRWDNDKNSLLNLVFIKSQGNFLEILSELSNEHVYCCSIIFLINRNVSLRHFCPYMLFLNCWTRDVDYRIYFEILLTHFYRLMKFEIILKIHLSWNIQFKSMWYLVALLNIVLVNGCIYKLTWYNNCFKEFFFKNYMYTRVYFIIA